MKKDNITLIGLPAVGKSTIGVLLAKACGYDFVDVDIVIQQQTGKRLEELISERGTEGFLQLEDEINASLDVAGSVIAPGGSVIYGERAMRHLKEIGRVVYLQMSFEDWAERLGDFKSRGVAIREGLTLRDLYDERVVLYERYADITIPQYGNDFEKIIEDTIPKLREALQV